MKCTYCDCLLEATGKVNGHDFCTIHCERLSQVKITNRKLGHESKYSPEQEVDFDLLDDMKLHKNQNIGLRNEE